MSTSSWQPTASLPTLQARAELNQQIRTFFRERGVLEVETPLLSHAIGTDLNLHPVAASYEAFPGVAAQTMFLQTSPEFAMKRLLAAGSGPIYQLCKAFRNGEEGRRHNPEFTMLEWYRPGFTLTQLMDEVEALVESVLGPLGCRRMTYRQLFQEQLGIDPHTASLPTLEETAKRLVDAVLRDATRDTWLDLLYSQVIEPQLQDAVFIRDYPATQAALAKVMPDAEGQAVARRFELVIKGMEIANGYDELSDANQQRARFEADRSARRSRGLPVPAADERLLAALQQGLPDCAGVALGVDRLLMLRLGTSDIAGVLAFPHERA